MSEQTLTQIVSIGSDHGGFELKQELIRNLNADGYQILDSGCHSDASVDYPDFAKSVCQNILSGKATRGILICRSGNGMAMTANKYKNIRAALCYRTDTAELARAHNDANVLVLGADFIEASHPYQIVTAFLKTPFEGGRHTRRVQLIDPGE